VSLYLVAHKPSGPYYVVNTQSWTIIAECTSSDDANNIVAALLA
jgi:hypothetical protein